MKTLIVILFILHVIIQAIFMGFQQDALERLWFQDVLARQNQTMRIVCMQMRLEYPNDESKQCK